MALALASTLASVACDAPRPDAIRSALGAPSSVCREPVTPISRVQGRGDRSPLEGARVAVRAVVVGDVQPNDGDRFDSDLGGFFVQQQAADQDDDPASSEGLFVFAPNAPDVREGDVVHVEGRVTEFHGLTELTDVGEVVRCGRSPPVATELRLPLPEPDWLERLEGMLVVLPQQLSVAGHDDLDRYGELVLTLPEAGHDRLFQPTSHLPPGAAAAAAAEAQALRRITLDDGRSEQNPDPVRHPNGRPFTRANDLRSGDALLGVQGVVHFAFGSWRLQPTGPAEHRASHPRPERPPEVGGSLRVAAFNVENAFVTLGSRGAADAQELRRQRAKLIATLRALDADIVGLVEIENRARALSDLVDALNAEAEGERWAAVRTGPIGPDEIRVALIYRPASVAPLGAPAVLDDPAFLDPTGSGAARNRPVLAHAFRTAQGAVVTAAVVHLKSKGGACGPGDDDPLQGACNRTRTLAAARLAAWLASDPTGSNDPDLLLLGDLNAYDEEDPIVRLRAGANGRLGDGDDLIDLLEAFGGEDVYSYRSGDAFGHLDYALASRSLAATATGAAAWHVNADAPDLLGYRTRFRTPTQIAALYAPTPVRASDHDPLLVGIDPAPTAERR